MDILVHYKGARSQNLSCTHRNKERKQDTNIEFFMHGEAMRDEVQKKMGPGEGTIISFFQTIKFQIGPHYVRIKHKKVTVISINKMNHVVVEVE